MEENGPAEAQKKIRQIGDFLIERTLGQGTFGKVKQGMHVHTK